MSDDLAMQVAIARFNYSASELPEGCDIIASDLDESIANAVRSYLLSEERVEAAGQIIGDMLDTYNPASKSGSDAIARAALTAAMGGEDGR
ncbi:hypothetical protein [Sphingopyxis sp. JAI128]|uniref:hypothetical protein n=1 Tax=Sphingopyxis sp. JAI128 TaxID=2723066 RepID=UPI001C872854|nr:hypothetical protein [Sphingopyxis sp. JAI128]